MLPLPPLPCLSILQRQRYYVGIQIVPGEHDSHRSLVLLTLVPAYVIINELSEALELTGGRGRCQGALPRGTCMYSVI